MGGKKNTKILFICRASKSEGLGHLMRSCRVAKKLDSLYGLHSDLIVLGDRSVRVVAEKKFGITPGIIGNEQRLLAIISRQQPILTVFDMKNIEPSVFDFVSKYSTTASLSPFFNMNDQVAMRFTRHKDLHSSPDHQKRWSGAKYAVIEEGITRMQTSTLQANISKKKLCVGLSMGGADPENYTMSVVKELGRASVQYHFILILGSAYVHSLDSLISKIDLDNHDLTIHRTSGVIWEKMQSCSLVILRGGLTSFEAVLFGVPSVNILMNKQQERLLGELKIKQATTLVQIEDIDSLHKSINAMDNDRRILQEMHGNSKGLVDGKGATRVAKQLYSLCRHGC